ncbi:Apoptotic chromatin condensation inducer in the nucleus-like protein [Drosera capensis]
MKEFSDSWLLVEILRLHLGERCVSFCFDRYAMRQSTYPVLDNRPIDQWKVTELREELKSRKLSPKGLKEELVRRLDEAIRSESEVPTEEADNGIEYFNSAADTVVDESVPVVDDATSLDPESKTADAQLDGDGITPMVDDVGEDVTQLLVDQGQQKEASADGQAEENELSTDDSLVGAGRAASHDLPGEISLGSLEFQTGSVEKDDEDSRDSPVLDDIKPSHEDVSEVNSNLGFQVSSDSLPSDSISINETNDIKDNKIADDVKLELDAKREMVQPSSIDVVPGPGKSHPMDVEEPHEIKVSPGHAYSNIASTETSKKDGSADLGSPEKLNLDQSSGDDMDDDASESKQIESTYNPNEVGAKKSDVSMVKDHTPLVEKEHVHAENKSAVSATTEKRKLSDNVLEVSEPSKRQRRWNSAKNLKVTEPNYVDLASSTTPKNISQHASLSRSLSLSNNNTSVDSPKEQIVPPPTRSPTNSLRIDRFLRPFTLKAVQELLGRTGTVTSFWMDHIKTHCYVTYSSEEEAKKTRSALFNLQWPPNGGRLLIAEFVEPEEVKLRLGPPAPLPQASAHVGAGLAPPPPPATLPLASPRLAVVKRQQPPQQPVFTLPPPPSLPAPPAAREFVLPPPPPLPEKIDPPIVTLDDLFRKTKATPRIYYLPLTDKQVQTKLEARAEVARQ